MTRRVQVAAYMSVLASLSFVAVYRWTHALPRVAERSAAIGSAADAPLGRDDTDSTFAELEATIVSNDAFRLANAPASVRFDPAAEVRIGTLPSGSPAARPTLTLKAIVGGPPWLGVVDGIPGQPPGTIVSDGSAFEKLTVRSVTRDSIIIQGPDTAWVLSFRRRF